jgi:hypothetical protein
MCADDIPVLGWADDLGSSGALAVIWRVAGLPGSTESGAITSDG